jgi:hypothetical protein
MINPRDETKQRLGWGVAELHEELDKRNSELDLLRAELELVRVLSRRPLDSAGPPLGAINKRVSAFRSALAFLEHSLLAAWQELHRVRMAAVDLDAIRKSGLFDSDWYLKCYPDVAKREMDPLQHYFKFGAWEGRNPHPLFDTDWYRTAYSDPSVQAMTALGHFVLVGAAKGNNPNPLFQTSWYVARNPDAADAQLNPLRH